MSATFEAVATNGVIRLPTTAPPSAHCVVAIVDDLETLRADAEAMLPDAKQRRMSELLRKNREAELDSTDVRELDELTREFDAATLVKGRAIALLSQFGAPVPSDTVTD